MGSEKHFFFHRGRGTTEDPLDFLQLPACDGWLLCSICSCKTQIPISLKEEIPKLSTIPHLHRSTKYCTIHYGVLPNRALVINKTSQKREVKKEEEEEDSLSGFRTDLYTHHLIIRLLPRATRFACAPVRERDTLILAEKLRGGRTRGGSGAELLRRPAAAATSSPSSRRAW